MMKRISREYLVQILAFGVSIADRVVIAGVLIRLWGVDGFASWTLALAITGMIGVFDFGFGTYFPNRMFFAVEQKRESDALHVLGAGNLMVGLASLVGLIAIIASQVLAPGAKDHSQMSMVLLLFLGGATAVRQAMGQQMAVYRAHQEFFLQSMVATLGDLARLLAILAFAFLGGGIVEIALVYLGATLLFSVAWPIWDTRRRYRKFAYRWAVPERQERWPAFRTSMLYWAQASVTTGVTFLPVVILGQFKASAFVVAQFALMRTLANLVRTTAQLFANVFGLEAARRIAVKDQPGLTRVYLDSSRFLTVQMGAVVGMLAAAGQGLFALWTGQGSMFDAMLFWLSVGPPLLLPTVAIAVQIMTCANLPLPLAYGRVAQLTLTLVAYALLPIDQVALRMMAALAIGEIVGLGIPVLKTSRTLIPDVRLSHHLVLLALGGVASLASWGMTMAGLRLGGQQPVLQLACGLVFGGLMLALLVWFLGLTGQRRLQFTNAIRLRLKR